MCGGGGAARAAQDAAQAEAARQAEIERQRLADEAAAAKAEADKRAQEEAANQAAILKQQTDDAASLRKSLEDQAAATLAQQQQVEKQREDERNADLAAAEKQRQDDAAAAAGKAVALQQYNTGRQAAVDNARGQIEQAFGGFDQGYYDKYAKDYTDAYTPQLNQQYDDAKRATTFNFADKGSLESSGAARAFGRVDQTKTAAAAQIAQNAQSSANTLKAGVDKQKADLLNSVFGAINSAPVITADNVGGANSSLNALTSALSSPVSLASSAAGSITPPAFGTLGSVFNVPAPTTGPRTTFGGAGSASYGSSGGGSGRLVA